jgi:Eukaryotic membrane protein family
VRRYLFSSTDHFLCSLYGACHIHSFVRSRHSYQLIQVSIVYTIYKFVLMPVDISIIYHWIQVFDRLMCSLGQDCLDSLYMRTTSMPRSSRMVVSVIVVLVYTALHSFLLFVHVATLNVAMNSDDQALLSLLIGGNFAEIKSTVFKKYNKASLFKIAASDICERFKLALFLALVLTLNMSQGMDQKMVYSYFHMCGIVWCAEWLSDWVKHSFITKFNYIGRGVYSEYGLLLAGDVTGIGHENLNLDHSHAVVKRLGLAQIPLVCVMAKYVKEAYKYAAYDCQPPTWMIGFGCFAVWSLLLVCKLSLGSFLHQISRKKLEVAPEFSKSNASIAKKQN